MKNFDVIVIASPSELPLVRGVLEQRGIDTNVRIIITGVGGINVYRALHELPKDTNVLNIGYCGSPDLPINAQLEIGKCDLSHKVDYSEPVFILDESNPNVCHTLTDFGTSGEAGCVYDMELAFICAMGFNVQAIKVVSDNMDLDEYEQNIKD